MMNPLWEPLHQIPSGHSVTEDMIRAIRKHLQKIPQYTLLIQAYRRKEEECKTNVWDTEEKRLQYVDAQAESIKIPFFLLLTTHLVDFLLFLFAVIQLTFVMQRRMSIPLLVPPMTLDEEAEFGDDADNK
jgi:hypothetical protein